MRKTLFILLSILFIANLVVAMGESPPPPEEEGPKYKLEILNMSVSSSPAQVLEEPIGATGPKYQLEILKMEVITPPMPVSPEAK
jgi:hypothetical protein